MKWLELLRNLPTHVAHPLALRYSVSSACECAATLLYGAHRALRLNIAARRGTIVSGRFGDLVNGLEGDFSELISIVDLFLTECILKPSDTDSLLPDIEKTVIDAIERCACPILASAVPDRPEVVTAWVGPNGTIDVPFRHGCTEPMTLVNEADGWSPFGPATGTDKPLPTIPFPLVSGTLWHEACDGRVIEKGPTPFSRLTPQRCLGRLIAWHYPEELKVRANSLPDVFAEVSGEVLAFMTATEEGVPESSETVRAFLINNRLEEQALAVDTFLLHRLDVEEQRLRSLGDMRGVSSVLIKRQEMQSGPERALTLTRLANMFRERLEDPEGAFWCLVTAATVTPMDATLIQEVLEEAVNLHKEEEAASKLEEVARTESGIARGLLASAAASLYEKVSNVAGVRRCIGLAGASADEEMVFRAWNAAKSSQDYDAMLEFGTILRNLVSNSKRRLEVISETAEILDHRFGRTAEALEWYHDACTIDPLNKDIVDRIVDIFMEQGRISEAMAVVSSVLERAFEPKLKAHFERRRAGLALELKDDATAVTALTSALTLDPDDTGIADALEALFERNGEWRRLLGLLRMRADKTHDNAINILKRMADIAEKQLADPYAALAFINEALRSAPDDQSLKERVRSIHESLGMWADVARDLESMSDGATDRALVLEQLADVYVNRLALRERAKEALARALEFAGGPDAVRIAKKLSAMCREDGERAKELAALEKAIPAMDESEVVETRVAMAIRLMEPPSDKENAKRYLEAAVAINPIHPVAVETLAGLYLSLGLPERVLALVEPLVARAKEDGNHEMEKRLRTLAAAAAIQISDQENAVVQYTRILELDPTDIRTKVVLGRLLAQLGKDSEALTILSAVLEGAADELTPMDLDEVESTAARCAARLNDHVRALNLLCSVLDRRGGRDPVLLKEVVAEAEAAHDHLRLASALEALVKIENDKALRFAGMMRLGDLYKNVLSDNSKAFDWYKAARMENPGSKAAVHKALETAVASGKLEEAKGLLVAMMELELDGLKRADYHYASAILIRDHFGDEDLVREQLTKAIELNPDHEEAVTALKELLLAKADNEGLAQLYQLLARHYRVSGQDAKIIATLKELARLYDEQLHNLPLAADTLYQVLQISPRDVDVAIRIADVLTRIPGRERDALAAHREAVLLDPTHVKSYRVIRDLCLLTGDEDGAWCAASALVALGEANEAEKAAFEANRQPALKLRRDQLPHESFVKFVVEAGADDDVARVFELIYEPLRRLIPWKRPKDILLSDSDLVDIGEKGMFQNMAQAVSRILGIPLPRIYRARGRSGIAKVAFDPPALAVGEDVLTTWRGKELRFGLGRALTTFMPGYLLAGISDAATLRLFFLAALRIAFPDYPVPEDAAGVEEMAKEIENGLSPEARLELKAIFTEYMRLKKAIDLHGFLVGVDKTANRTGLFLANDLVVAANQLQEDTLFLSDLEFGDRLTDLCAWAVSTRYSELRRLMLQL